MKWSKSENGEVGSENRENEVGLDEIIYIEKCGHENTLICPYVYYFLFGPQYSKVNLHGKMF